MLHLNRKWGACINDKHHPQRRFLELQILGRGESPPYPCCRFVTGSYCITACLVTCNFFLILFLCRGQKFLKWCSSFMVLLLMCEEQILCTTYLPQILPHYCTHGTFHSGRVANSGNAFHVLPTCNVINLTLANFEDIAQ